MGRAYGSSQIGSVFDPTGLQNGAGVRLCERIRVQTIISIWVQLLGVAIFYRHKRITAITIEDQRQLNRGSHTTNGKRGNDC